MQQQTDALHEMQSHI